MIAGTFNYTAPATTLNDENIVILGDLEKADPTAEANQRELAGYALAEIDRIIAELAEPRLSTSHGRRVEPVIPPGFHLRAAAGPGDCLYRRTMDVRPYPPPALSLPRGHRDLAGAAGGGHDDLAGFAGCRRPELDHP